MVPVRESEGVRNSASPKAIAAALPETRLEGSVARAGGHGPSVRMRRICASEYGYDAGGWANALSATSALAVVKRMNARSRITRAESFRSFVRSWSPQ